ncbi:Potassium channel AKT6 [Citrus sinensis]|uniref:Potassium channel AKT6 n=1 Tax=Citrus sinensis TaxID=2711 RepID=A0ACB8NNY9_CITSI|nr:Potassium channel AKT6 [Citrus sinensis]KAH9799235.1 Potassium channel AKT6 [Citrus sinensis]
MSIKKKRRVLFCGAGGEDDDARVGGPQDKDDTETFSREEEGSQISISDGILPSLGVTARSCRRITLRRFIISPFEPRYRLWETFLVFLVFYTAWACPFEFGFLNQPSRPLAITDNVVNAIFAIDIILTFFLAYLDKKIAWRYAKTWLTFDVISTIPSEAGRKFLPSALQAYGYFNMLRLWRLRRVSRLFARLEKDRNYSYIRVRYSKLACVTLFAVHCAACTFYLLAEHYRDPKGTWIGQTLGDFKQQSLWVRYVTSIYWSIATLTTTGYGDIHPVNTRERIFDIFFMFFNLGLTSYLLGNMNNLVVHGTARTRKFRDTIQAASSFARRNQLPVRLQDQMLAHLCLRHRTDSEGLQQQEIIESLPKAIQSSISHFLFYSLVDQVYLFRGVSNDLLFQLVTEMKAEYFPPKEDVILQNEAPTDLYILVTGAMVVGEAKPGDVVGELGLLCYKPQLFTVRTKRLSQLLRLNRTAFLSLVQANVGDGTIIMNNLLQRYRDFGIIIHENAVIISLAHMNMNMNCRLLNFVPCLTDSEGSVPLWEAMLGKHEPVVRILAENGALISSSDVGHFACTAIEQNDLLLLEKIVHYGGDVTQLTSNGTTPLHVAISEGNIEIVKFLIDQGSDIDKPDIHGWTPRALADHQGQEDIQILLQMKPEPKKAPVLTVPKKQQAPNPRKHLVKYSSEPSIPPYTPEVVSAVPEINLLNRHSRRRPNTFHNSLFGIVSAANTGEHSINFPTVSSYPPRVTISCPEKGQVSGKLVLLPNTKFGFTPSKILSKEGAEIDDVGLIRDDDHLFIVSDPAYGN